ncbi:hypothetical protein FA13DRAFT_465677 [Coprinellus micaceus]|uniref:Copper acquisition factor BIM1-like domain-containing protein n=1 Tax=Coprinellus micaceus TaxID=71717 RepID=A0A4Y7TYQ4_COPMI|nr:hypothetical protein FA13DRAFT_465677 [Coprinellus micaceus]
MLVSAIASVALFAAGASAHFRLNYPEPRGVFVAANEVNFCGGYVNAVSNRSTYPLSGGVFTINTGHAGFTVGVLLSTEQNPNSWESFSLNETQTFVRDYAREEGAGTFCIPLDIAGANIPGAVDGANVTIQVVFEGGDGNLYQCADLTLSSSFTTPSSVTCANETVSGHSESSTSTAPSTSSTSGSSGNSGVGQVQYLSGLTAAGSLALAGLAAALL